MHTRTLLAALAVTASTLVGGTAYATVSDEDQATEILDVTAADKTGDVHVQKDARGLPARITHSVAMKQVGYHIDRTAETLTITYPLQRVLNNDRFHQLVGTLVTTDKKSNVPMGEVFSSASKTWVRVFTYAGGNDFSADVCKAATSSTDTKADEITQTVPFSCLGGVLDHGYLRSFALIEARKGADLALDATPFTRDLPLSTYVAPQG